MRRTFTPALLAASLLMLAGCETLSSMSVTPEISAAVAAPDRSEADRKLDERRKPELLLAFAQVRPGMRVLDLGAGAGYSTELLARAVGARGTVYGQNSQAAIDRYLKGRFDERIAKFPLKNVVKVVRPDQDPVPPNVAPFDLVTIFFTYHDTPADNIDRPLLLKRIFDSMKPGGMVVVADHAARKGDGTSVSGTLHRIEESVVRSDFEQAGFRYDGAADFLRNSGDPRTAPVFRSPIPVDEFVMRFVRP
jgi:predicted methyltransferase